MTIAEIEKMNREAIIKFMKYPTKEEEEEEGGGQLVDAGMSDIYCDDTWILRDYYSPQNYWEEIMKILEHIKKLGYPYLLSEGVCTIYKTWMVVMISHEHNESTKQAAYLAIVHFIDWYNEQDA